MGQVLWGLSSSTEELMGLFWGRLSQVEGAAAPQQDCTGVSMAPGHKRWSSGLSDTERRHHVLMAQHKGGFTRCLACDKICFH